MCASFFIAFRGEIDHFTMSYAVRAEVESSKDLQDLSDKTDGAGDSTGAILRNTKQLTATLSLSQQANEQLKDEQLVSVVVVVVKIMV